MWPLFLDFRPFNWKIIVKSINQRVWSPKTMARQILWMLWFDKKSISKVGCIMYTSSFQISFNDVMLYLIAATWELQKPSQPNFHASVYIFLKSYLHKKCRYFVLWWCAAAVQLQSLFFIFIILGFFCF